MVSMVNIMMNRTRSQIIRYLVAHGPATCHQVGAALNVPASRLNGHLTLLRQAGIVTLASERYCAQVDEIERQFAELAATFQPTGSDSFRSDE